MKKRIISVLLCFCISIGLLPQTNFMRSKTLITNAAVVSTTTEFIDGREVIRITNANPKDNPYGVGTSSTSSLKLFLNILRSNLDSYIIMETDITIAQGTGMFKGIINKDSPEVNKSFEDVQYMLYPEVDTFNGVLDGNGHTIANLRLSANNYGPSHSSNVGMIHTLSATGVIKNLTLDTPKIYDEVRMITIVGVGGFLAYENKGIIENCTIKDAEINLCSSTSNVSFFTGGANSFGGFVATNSGTIRDCHVEGMDINLPHWPKSGSSMQPTGFGGIANTNNGTIENCVLNDLFIYKKVYCHTRGADFTNFGGAVGVNTGTVSNVHVGYELYTVEGAEKWRGDPGSLFYVNADPDNGIYQWFTSNVNGNGKATAFGRVIGSNSGTYLGLTSILTKNTGDVYTVPDDQPLRNRMIGNDNASTAGSNNTKPYDISVTFSQADLTKNGDTFDGEFSILSSEDATAFYKLSETAVTDANTLELNGTSATLTANTSRKLTLSGLEYGKTYTCYVVSKNADNTWSDIKSFSVITPKNSPELVLKNLSESLDRTYTGTPVEFTQDLFEWSGDGDMTLSYYCYNWSGIVKTTTDNSGAVSEGAPPMKVLTGANDTYYIRATLTASGEYEPASITVPFKILQAETEFDEGIQVYVNDTLKTAPYGLTYGDVLTVKVKPAIAGTTNSTIKSTGNMAIYAGGTQLCENVLATDENGYYTMVYDTSDKKVLPGDLTVTAKYSGSNEMKPLNEDFNIALNKRVISFTSTDPILNCDYTGSTIFTGELYNKYSTLGLPNLLPVDMYKVNISGTITSPSANAGEYYTGFTFDDPHLIAGKDGDLTAYYSLDADSVNNGYVLINKFSLSDSGITYNINVIQNEGNFDEPIYARINDKGTYTYKYNGTDITYQEIKDMLKAADLGSTFSVTFTSKVENNINYTGHYYGKINFTVTSMLFNSVDEGLSVNLSNRTYGVSWGDKITFDPSKISCTGAGGVNVTGTFSLLVDNAPFDPLIYPKSVDGNNVEIKHNYKLIFNSSDGTIQNKEVKVGSNITISKRLVAVECLTPVLYYKKDISQQPKIRMTNKVGDDEISVSLNSGNTNAGYYTSGVSLSGNDAKQYHTDYYEGGNKWVSVSYQIVGLEFTGSLTPKASPVYGDTWNDIFTLKQTDFTATANGESISGTYRLQLNNAGWHDITGTDIAKYGYNYYRVLFTSDEFGDTVVSTDSLPAPTNGTFLNVAKREVTIEWSNTELIYNGQYQRPIATITNKVGNDDVGVTLNTQAKYVGTYPVSVYELIGADMNNYKLPDPKPSHEFSIAAINQEPLNITPVGDLTYRTDTTISFSTTGGIDGGYVSYSVPENNGVLEISGGNTYIIGAGKVTVTATKIKEGYNKTTATLEIEVKKGAAPTITFPTASSITYGQKLSESTLLGESTEFGTFAWTNGDTVPTITNSGYEVTFTPSADTINNYEAITNTTNTVAISVTKATPAVSVNTEISGVSGNRTAILTATITGMGDNPTGEVQFIDADTNVNIGTPSAISSEKATYTWMGLDDQIYRVKAVYTGDENYNTQTSATIEFNTSKQNQTALSIGDIETKTYGDSEFTLSVNGGSGTGAVSYTSSDSSILSISGDTATIHKAGTVTITATKAEDNDYNESVSSTAIIIGKKALTVNADDKLNIIKGATMPEFTYTATGLVGEDVFTAAPEMTTTAADTNTAGEYDITIGGGTLDNSDSYNVTYTNGKLTVVSVIYTLTVTNGTGGGSYGESELVTITADSPATGKVFDKWATTDGVTFASATSATTTFAMPGKDVTVTANYSANSNGNGGNGGDSTTLPDDVTTSEPTLTIPKIIKAALNDANPLPIQILNTSNNEFKKIKAEVVLSKATDAQKTALKNMTEEQIQAEIKKSTDAIATVNTTKITEKAKAKIAEVKKDLPADAKIMPINFTVHTEFAFPIQVTIPVDKTDYPAGTYYLYYHNEETGKVEDCGTATIDKNGNATFTISHCSDYFISSKTVDLDAANTVKTADTTTTNDETNPKTGNTIPVTIIFAIIVLIFIYFKTSIKKKLLNK